MDSMITACTLYVSQNVSHGDNIVIYHLWKSWLDEPSAVPFPDWGAGLTHITWDHHLTAVTIGLLLVCAAFAFAYGRIR